MSVKASDTAKKPVCSIIIRAYNEEKHIGRLLTGIMQQNFSEYEIILVDSGSTDATLAIASRYPVRIVHIEPQEFTFGYSLNQGISHANGDFIVIVSAHVYPVYPDWLEMLIKPFDDPQVALTYGKQRGNRSTKYSEHQVFARWFPEKSQRRQTHPFCNNANAAIRKELWLQHAYNETLTGLEDLEWAKWALSQGYVLSYVAEAEVIHVHEETPRAVYNRYRREAMAFKQIFPEEQFGFWDFVRLFFSNAFTDSIHALRDRCFFQVAASVLWFRLMQFWGTYRGYRNSGPVTTRLRETFYYPAGLRHQTTATREGILPIDYQEVDHYE